MSTRPALKYEIAGTAPRVRDMPARLRPREEAERVGIRNVSDAALLALILRRGVRGLNVVDLAEGLLRKYGSLTALASASTAELARVRGLGTIQAQVLSAALEVGRRITQESLPDRFKIASPEDVARLLSEDAQRAPTEIFWAIPLDAKNRVKGRPLDITRGLQDASLVHPREVFREVIHAAAVALVLAHNHPSGDVTPSAEDVRISRQLVEAGRILDIKVLDHVILGKRTEARPSGFLSMREEGVVNFGG